MKQYFIGAFVSLVLAFIVTGIDMAKGCQGLWECIEWATLAPGSWSEVTLVAKVLVGLSLAFCVGILYELYCSLTQRK